MTTYRLAGSVMRANLNAEEVLLNTDTGEYHVLNAMGRRVLSELEAGVTTDEVAELLADGHGAPLGNVRADLDEFVQGLVRRGLMTEEPAR